MAGLMEILTALITGGLALLGVVLSNRSSERRTRDSIRTSQAVTDAKLENLTQEVRRHNHFAARMPVVEEQIKVINHRLQDLEQLEKG